MMQSERQSWTIGRRTVGSGQPCFIIAEIGSNHDGSLEIAKTLIREAAKAGADAVKFQSFRAATLAAPRQERLQKFFKQAELDPAWYQDLIRVADEEGVVWLSTPFDDASADALGDLGMPVFKVSSGDLTDHRLLQRLARWERPIILSTGMAWLGEVEAALGAIRTIGHPPLVLLHCVTAYPSAPEDANIRAMARMGEAFGVPYGYSDHCLGVAVPLGAVALGACVIEKHFTSDRSRQGPDHGHSLEASEFALMVREIRSLERALGDGVKAPVKAELPDRVWARRGLYATQPIAAGATITPAMVARLRPNDGIGAEDWDLVIGRVARQAIEPGAALHWDLL
ncbi:MAG: N-acetylneuraminate synthase family protein [Nitrospirota bacterium]|nr:N-acetylneuraminate synthase family protein [Nitrospirota bacterium]MDE3241124.1 N-acetylneuraminate synthase family protein [Nitrospirota bacterium]